MVSPRNLVTPSAHGIFEKETVNPHPPGLAFGQEFLRFLFWYLRHGRCNFLVRAGKVKF